MSIKSKIKRRTKRRELRTRNRLHNPSNLPRVVVFRSLNNIYAQVVDDAQHHTVASFSSRELKKIKGTKADAAQAVGQELAKRALDKGITKAIFDRGSYLFHGRVKSLVQGLKDGGLQI